MSPLTLFILHIYLSVVVAFSFNNTCSVEYRGKANRRKQSLENGVCFYVNCKLFPSSHAMYCASCDIMAAHWADFRAFSTCSFVPSTAWIVISWWAFLFISLWTSAGGSLCLSVAFWITKRTTEIKRFWIFSFFAFPDSIHCLVFTAEM